MRILLLQLILGHQGPYSTLPVLPTRSPQARLWQRTTFSFHPRTWPALSKKYLRVGFILIDSSSISSLLIVCVFTVSPAVDSVLPLGGTDLSQ
ncbi:hypothetical protein M405DRAFT_808204 [Rhizopogon salebrosus TDB-379]|nr:hypothetical protein M405DRAFT_808204 [Rhizopogon salebrosus TDB-379]